MRELVDLKNFSVSEAIAELAEMRERALCAGHTMARAIDEGEPIESVDMWGGRIWRFWR